MRPQLIGLDVLDPGVSPDVAGLIAQAARDISTPTSISETLQLIAAVAADSLLPEIDAVGITLVTAEGQFETAAASHGIVHDLDRLQYEAGEGPCVQAIEDCTVVTVNDLRHEQRWPRFVQGAARLGLRAQMGVCLHTNGVPLGGLNMYSLSSDTISEQTMRVADLFAAHAAIALGASQQLANLTQALATRQVIGQATGILMERLGIGEDGAFSYLTRISSTTETKLRMVAQDVIDDHNTRHLPG